MSEEVMQVKRAIRTLLATAALLLVAMCAVVAIAYRDMRFGVEQMGYSAPAEVALVYAIPFAIGIGACLTAARALSKRSE